MIKHLSLDAIHTVLASTDENVFHDADTISDDVLWALVEAAFINPIYRDCASNLAYQKLFAPVWPTDIAERMFTTTVLVIEAEPFFRMLGPNRYNAPSAVYKENGNFKVVWPSKEPLE